MRQAATTRLRNSKSRLARTKSIPAPVGGWNDRDSIADMDKEDAVELINFFPTTKDVMARKGFTKHVTGMAGQNESLMPYSAIDGTDTLFAAEGTDFFDVTSPGAVGAAVQTGLTNARWQSVNNTVGATSYLTCFNGVDSPRYWDGTIWITITGASTPAITGVTTSDLINVSIHKRRMWLTEADTLSAWYLPVDAVGGAATEFTFGGIAQKGGHLIATASWSIDGGDGLDDYFVAVTSEGEVIVFRGTDPGAIATWALVGVWQIGRPIGRRCFLKYGGELLLISKDGVIPLSRGLLSSQVARTEALSYDIRGAVSDATDLHSTNFGWQLEHYPEANMLLLNVPVKEGAEQEQYVMNTITGAWARFKAISANCWAIHNERIFFGSNTFVGEFWNTLADDGANIQADLQQAYSYFGSLSANKYFTLIRPIILTDGVPEIFISINVDFNTVDPTSQLSIIPETFGEWDTSKWDGASWGGDPAVRADWTSVGAVGFSAGVRLRALVNGQEFRFISTDYVYEGGGIVG